MANALEEISREHLECAICCEAFQNPRLLPCLHSFCNDCLFNYLKDTATKIVCPTCRRSYDIPDGDLSKFPINFPLRNLVDAICNKQKSLTSELGSVNQDRGASRPDDFAQATCDSCGQTSTVVANCTDCKHDMCQFCTDAHLRVLAFKDHDFVGVSNLNQYSNQTEPMQQKCSSHPGEAARYFCLKCRVMICSDCAITEHRSPDHDVMTLKEANQRCREFLRKKLDTIIAIADELDKTEGQSMAEQMPPSEKGDVIQTRTQRARNACQIAEQALAQSSDEGIDFLVLFDTLDMMLQQICDEFSEAGYLSEPDGNNASKNESKPLSPLAAALQALSLTASRYDPTRLPPFLQRHPWRHHLRPPPHLAGNHPPHGPHHWHRPPGCHRPPWFGGAEGPHHPHPWRPHHRGRGRGGHGRGRGHCQRK